MFKKVKTEHHILKEFHNFLKHVEKDNKIIRLIPWRIHRKQKKSSIQTLHFSYFTTSWMKFKMNKWSTSQELFVICDSLDKEYIKTYFNDTFNLLEN